MRRAILALLVLAMFAAASCAPGFESPAKVSTLRILAVTADKPYALAGDEVTFRMTVYDGLDPEAGPRPLQILWIGGCFDPVGDQYFLCFAELAKALAPLAEPGAPMSDLVKLEQTLASASGVPDAHAFSLKIPVDIVSRRPVPETGPHYGIAYVFFAACAGTLAPAPLETLGSKVPEFPVRCLDPDGNPQGPESFVPGYTQIYAFADERQNANPAVDGLTLDGQPIPDDLAEAPVVKRCPLSAEDRRQAGCGSAEVHDGCTTYRIGAVVGDVAEIDPGAVDADGKPLREAVWVSYFADAGDLDPSIALVSDARQGLIGGHDSEWLPPAEPSLVTFWAVVRDQRGGGTVVRRFVRVE